MSEETRFDSLMDALSTEDEPSAKAESKSKGKKSKPLPISKDPNYKQIGVYLPTEVHRKMKIGAAITGLEMSAIAEAGIQMWLKKNVPNS
ncbi:MAG: hypothetical protein WBD47_09430 [Phormidesmis sp.]